MATFAAVEALDYGKALPPLSEVRWVILEIANRMSLYATSSPLCYKGINSLLHILPQVHIKQSHVVYVIVLIWH